MSIRGHEEDGLKQNFHVEIERTTTHLFVVDEVNSQEEAEMVAEEWLEDGEEGAVLDKEIVNIDSYPVNPQEDIN